MKCWRWDVCKLKEDWKGEGVSKPLSGEADDATHVTLSCADTSDWTIKAICEKNWENFAKIYF
jgi:hypothetical protein